MTTTAAVMDAMTERIETAPEAVRSMWLEQLSTVTAEFTDAPAPGRARERVEAMLAAMAKPTRAAEPVWTDGDFMTFSTCHASDLRNPRYAALVAAFEVGPSGWIFHRNNWERAAIAHHLDQGGALSAGRRGLGFGPADGALSTFLAGRGVDVEMLDRLPEPGGDAADAHGGRRRHFLWSTRELNGRGDRATGAEFIARSTRDLLRPGGLAVHVFDFALEGRTEVWDSETLSALLLDLRRDGHGVAPFLVAECAHVLDLHEDAAPYSPNPHLRLRTDGGLVTSAVLVVRKR